jgi:predicted phage terminase large subunit-like protein
VEPLEDQIAKLQAAAAARKSRAQSAKLSAVARPTDTMGFAHDYRHFPHETPSFHNTWYAAMDDDSIKRVFIQGPRYHAKTTTILTYVLHRLVKNHHLRVGILSQTDELAKHFLAEVKHELASNAKLRKVYNHGKSFVGDTWAMNRIVLADARDGPNGISGKDVSLFSVSRGSQITGYHCDLLIVDDLESKGSTDSDSEREKTRQWWAREVVPVVVPGGRILATGTRKHFDDLYSYWMKPGTGWTVIDDVKAVYGPDGTPIWPEMWDEAALLAKKAEMDAQDLLAWPQEFLNEPRPSETQMFYPDRWPKIRVRDIPSGLTIIQYWDLAISEKTTADYTVGWCIGVDENNSIYPLEQRRGHWDFNKTLSEIAAMGNAWSGPNASGNLVAVGIEQVAYQAAAVQEAARRTMLPIVPVVYKARDKTDKVQRARLLEARAAVNRVFHPVETNIDGFEVDPSWWQAFVAEAMFFPAGAHDDQVDALSGAVKLAGWQADAISWQYNVWKCVTCKHPFLWEANRPCPKCSTKAPATYDNPELVSMGAMGSVTSSAGNDPGEPVAR